MLHETEQGSLIVKAFPVYLCTFRKLKLLLKNEVTKMGINIKLVNKLKANTFV